MSNLVKSNINQIDNTDLTTIEIALEINEKGETTAMKLYKFLDLVNGQLVRWAKTNITENAFAIEHEDFEGFHIDVDGNNVKNYKLSASFDKKLAMVWTRNQKGEVAKEYFIKN